MVDSTGGLDPDNVLLEHNDVFSGFMVADEGTSIEVMGSDGFLLESVGDCDFTN